MKYNYQSKIWAFLLFFVISNFECLMFKHNLMADKMIEIFLKLVFVQSTSSLSYIMDGVRKDKEDIFEAMDLRVSWTWNF